MGIKFSLIALGLVCVMAAGCAKKQPQPEVNPTVVKFEKFRQTYDASTADGGEFVFEADEIERAFAPAGARETGPDAGVTSIVLARAHRSIGTPYVFGGTKPGGFDCSGLVQWAYQGAGIRLPRTAREQSQSGFGIRDKSKMRAGDIVAFRRRGGYHTGIYIGDGKFIHAPRRNKRVRIESMDTGYFAHNFIGARRVDTSRRSVELAQATEQADKKYTTTRKSKPSRKSVASKSKSSKKTVASGSAKSSRKTEQASRNRTKKQAVAKSKAATQKKTAAARKQQVAQASRARSSRTTQTATKKSAAPSARKSQTRADNKKIEVRPAKRTVNEVRKAKGSASNEGKSRQSKG